MNFIYLFRRVDHLDYVTSPFFGWFIGIGMLICLLLPEGALRAIANKETQYRAWKNDLGSFGTQKTSIKRRYSRKQFWVWKLVYFIIFTYCVLLLLNHYEVITL